MKIKTIKKDKKFVPDWNGNKDLPEAEQVVVKIKEFPSLTEAQGYRGFKMSEGGAMELSYSADSIMLTRHVKEIKNLIVDDEDGKEVPVTNGAQLAKCKALELAGLISAIREYLLESAELVPEGES